VSLGQLSHGPRFEETASDQLSVPLVKPFEEFVDEDRRDDDA
jgi:hypothetical protein